MWPVSARFLDALRSSHAIIPTATHRNLSTGVTTDLPIQDGAVTVDATKQIRRSLALTLPGLQSLWDKLDAPGGEITVTQSVRYVDGKRETVPLGVFIVDQDQMGYAPGDTISLTCPDRMLKVQRNRFGLTRTSVRGNEGWQEIKRLVEAPWSGSIPFPGWAQLDMSYTAKVGSRLWDDGDRGKAITDLCTAGSVEVFFDPHGQGVLRPVPVLTPSSRSVWTVDASERGVMLAADRARDLSNTRNAVIASTSATDVKFAPQEVRLTTAGDPLAVGGPLGYVPYYYSSPSLRSDTQAHAAARTLLYRQLGVAKQITLEAVANPALDAEDVILVLLPKVDRNTSRPVELHMIDTVSIPLAPAGRQQILTRSTRPDTDGA